MTHPHQEKLNNNNNNTLKTFSQSNRLTNNSSHHLVATFLLTLCISVTQTGAQYSSSIISAVGAASSQTGCDSTRLIRCQQEILRDLQSPTGTLLAGSGPPYSPKQQFFSQQQQQLTASGLATCRLVRSNLDCLLSTTPACYDQGIQTAQNTDLILRAKRFLEQAGCNSPESSWPATLCYRSSELARCEDRYGFSPTSSPSSSTSSLGYLGLYNSGSHQVANLTACLGYQAFRYCVDTHLRMNCKVHEMDMINEYLIDRASDLAWRCPPLNSTSAHHYNNLVSPSTYLLSPLRDTSGPGAPYYGQSAYQPADQQQRVPPAYVGSSGSLGSGAGVHAWERFRNPNLEQEVVGGVSRFGVSRFPSSNGLGGGEIFDRLVAGNGFDPDSSDCPVRAAPYVRECEDNLLEQQRLAKDSRDGNELQRRICCSLFQYRDCVSRVVLDRCADSSPTAVEILMGVRRREMTFTCRNFNRDVCSGTTAGLVLNKFALIAATLLTSFLAFKRQLALV